VNNEKSIFIFGFGYTASHLARELIPQGWQIAATTRDPHKRKELERLGIQASDFPADSIPAALENAANILISTPPNTQGDPVLRLYRDAIACTPRRWIGYLSSTGVYGDHQGGWVDETTPLEPLEGRNRYRQEAESSWLQLHEKLKQPVHIFRLSGIYGAGRNPLQKLKEGKEQRVFKEGQVFSRIHAEDIAAALQLSLQTPTPGQIFNLSDNEPAPGHEVLEYAAQLLEILPPPLVDFDKANLSPMAQEFYSANRRVSNEKIKKTLGWKLRYPTYREGLKALLDTQLIEI
jgi:nucleoside-diphosphate-sugar epimerase